MDFALVIQAFDDSCLRWLNNYMLRSPLFDKIIERLLNADELKFGVLIAVFCWLWFKRDGDRRERRAGVTVAIAGGLVGMVFARLFALLLPFRERPLARSDLGFPFALPADFETPLRTWSAFPSDHAVLAFALATGLWLISRRLGAIAFLHAFFVIGLPRVYFGLHHPSDVIVGAVFGILVTLLVNQAPLRERLVDATLRFEARATGPFYAASFLLLHEMAIVFASLRALAQSSFKLLRIVIG